MSRLGKILVGPSEHIICSKFRWFGNLNSTSEKIAVLLRTSWVRPSAPLDSHRVNPSSCQDIRLESSPYFKIDEIFWNKRLELFKTTRSANPHSDTRQNTRRWNRTFSVLYTVFSHLSVEWMIPNEIPWSEHAQAIKLPRMGNSYPEVPTFRRWSLIDWSLIGRQLYVPART